MRTYAAALVGLVVVLSGCARTTAVPEPVAGDPSGRPAAGWTRLPDPPLAGRTNATVVGLGDRVLVVGGWTFLCPPGADCVGPDDAPFRDGAIWDARSQTWQPVADAPVGFAASEAVVVGDDVFVTTSCRDAGCRARPVLLRYDVSGDSWEELGPVPTGADPVSLGGRLLFASGTDEDGEHPDVLYDVDTGEWGELPDDPLPDVYDRFAVVDDERVLVFGSPMVGPDEEGGDKVAAAYDLRDRTWSRLPDAPGPGYQAWRSGGEVWLNPHFGRSGGGVLDLRTDRWSDFPAPPPGLDDDEPVDLAGLVGQGSATYEYSSGWVRDTRTDRWLRVPDNGEGRSDETVAAVGEALLVFGGQRWDGDDGELLAETWLWRPPG